MVQCNSKVFNWWLW